MSDDITKRPQSVAFRPERIMRRNSDDEFKQWTIMDIRVGNVSQIPRTWTWAWWRLGLRKIWRRLTWFWPRKPQIMRLL